MSVADSWLAAFRLAGEDLFAAGLVSPGSGNLSVWTPHGVLVTREGAPLHRLTTDDLCLISRTTEPPKVTPSHDTPIHRAIHVRTGANVAVHAQPIHAVALSLERETIVPVTAQGRRLLGRVPVVDMRNVVQAVSDALSESVVVLVAGHGCYARGSDFEATVRAVAALEEAARVEVLRRSLGLPMPPPPPDE